MRSQHTDPIPDPEPPRVTRAPGERDRLIIDTLQAAGRPMTHKELSAVVGYPLSAGRQIPREVVRVAIGWYALSDMQLGNWRAPASKPRPPRPPRSRPMKLDGQMAGVVNDFLSDLTARNCSPRTAVTYGYVLPQLLEGITRVENLTPDSLRDAMLRCGRMKANSIRSYWAILRSFCGWLVTRGLLAENPAAKLSTPKSEPVPFHALDEQQVRAVFDACLDDTERLAVRLLLTGLRAFELLSLRWEDVDVDHRTIHVRHGKGNKTRRVPAELETLAALAQYPRYSDHIIDMAYKTLSRRVHRLGQRVGLPWTLNCHDFRRTTAALWIENGGDTGDLQMILGHANLAQTLYYGRGVRADSAVRRGLEMGLAGRLLDAHQLPPQQPSSPDAAALVDAVLACPAALALLFARLGERASGVAA